MNLIGYEVNESSRRKRHVQEDSGPGCWRRARLESSERALLRTSCERCGTRSKTGKQTDKRSAARTGDAAVLLRVRQSGLQSRRRSSDSVWPGGKANFEVGCRERGEVDRGSDQRQE